MNNPTRWGFKDFFPSDEMCNTEIPLYELDFLFIHMLLIYVYPTKSYPFF